MKDLATSLVILVASMLSFIDSAKAFGLISTQPSKSISTPAGTPSFVLAWSEYPSWSAFDVASTNRLIDGRKGYMNSLEQKWNVDIELRLLDYDPCITAYASNKVDAVCITNIDILSCSLTRQSTAILPTSTSFGGDALIVPNSIGTLEDLKGQTVYGLGKSVSEYVFQGILEANNATNLGIKFDHMDPGAAASLVQQNDNRVRNIVVWNPYVLQTLKNAKNATGQLRTHVLGDSTQVPLEVLDMVVVGEDVLSKNGGGAFASCICEAFYGLNRILNDSSSRDDTLIAIGEKFSSLGLADMRKVVDQTRFFDSPQKGIDLFSNRPVSIASKPETNLQSIMTKVVDRCTKLSFIDKTVVISYGSDEVARKANLRFDPQYMMSVDTPSINTAPVQSFPPSPGNSPPLRKTPNNK